MELWTVVTWLSLKITVNQKKAEVIFVTCVFILVFGCFCIPIIIYATSSDVTPITELGIIELEIDNCLQQSSTTIGSQQISIYNASCSQYDGVCNGYLSLLTDTNNTVTRTMYYSAISEEQVSEFFDLLQGLSGLVSEECSAAVMPFVCQYAYPPCDRNGSPLLITKEQCVNIRDDVCANEWRIAITTEFGALLPTCEAIKSENNFSSGVTVNTSEPLKCHYQFGEYCGLCLPLCGSFSLYSVQLKFAIRGIIIFSCAVGVIVGGIIIIAAVLRWKKMLVFPQMLAVCTVIGIIILGVFVMISYLGGQERLYCSHKTVHLSILEPSPFTEIAGFAFQFGLLFIAITWFLHVFHLFQGLAFPFWTSKFFSEAGRRWKLCILEVLGAILFSSTGPTIVMLISEYRLGRFPPLFPRPNKKLILYTFLLPLTVLLAIGVNLTFFSFWTIHKTSGLFKRERGKGICGITFSVPQVKILLLLGYVIVFGITSLLAISIDVSNADALIDDLYRYFECNLFGYNPECESIRTEFEKHLSPGLISSIYVQLALVSCMHLLFVIQAQDVKRALQWIRECRILKNTLK